MTATHEATEVRELGYKTLRCSECGRAWPCPPRRIQYAWANGTYEAGDWVAVDIADAVADQQARTNEALR